MHGVAVVSGYFKRVDLPTFSFDIIVLFHLMAVSKRDCVVIIARFITLHSASPQQWLYARRSNSF